MRVQKGGGMSECNVCVYGYDGDDGYIELFEQKIVKCRKEHRCEECRRVIAKGNKCERTSGLWEGSFMASHTCLDCMYIRNGLACDGQPALGMLWEEIENADVYRNLTTGCLQKIETASAKAYLLERWRAWKGLVE